MFTADSVTYYIMPMLMRDSTCPKPVAVVCKNNQYKDTMKNPNVCVDCDKTCGTCSASGADKCTTCPNGALPVAGKCGCTKTGEVLDTTGKCVTLAAAETAVKALKYDDAKTIESNTVYMMNLYNDKLKSCKIPYDPANPCKGADGKACNS